MIRPRRLVIGIVVVFALAAAGLFAWKGVFDLLEPRPAPPTVANPSPSFGSVEAARLQEALSSNDPIRVAQVVPVDEADALDGKFVTELARMSIRIDSSTFTMHDSQIATVVADSDSPDGGSASWILVIRPDDTAGWRLVSTVPVP